MEPITLAAVAYDPKVVTIWEGMRDYFERDARLPVEIVLYQSYPAQVRALLAGRVDVAWNTNLAFVQCEAWSGGATRALAMRDTDVGWTTKIVSLAGGPVRTIRDLDGRTLALGSRDSGHAAVLPVHFLEAEGLVEGKSYTTLRFDLDVGKHGDTGTSELDVVKAVLDGRADAGAVGSPFWDALREKGLLPVGALREAWTSPAYTHCMFTARPGLPDERGRALARALEAMSWDDPRHRAVLEAEGLKRWIAPVDGYASLREAARRKGLLERPAGLGRSAP